MPTVQTVPDTDMPQLFQAADAASLDGQRQYVNGTRLRLVFIVLAAATGVVSWRIGDAKVDVLALGGMVCFVIALVIETVLWKARPDRAWYDARAVAESAKTLAWKFAVGAEPFPSSMRMREATKDLVDRLGTVRDQFRELELKAIDAPAVSAWMAEQRNSSLDDRRRAYLDARVRDQKAWYTDKAEYNRHRSQAWRIVLVLLELAGVTGSLVEAFVRDGVLIAPTVAALVGSVVAWVETKQHDSLARAYAAAVTDLSNAEAKLLVATTEADWAVEVHDAEEAISREHTLWHASRSRR